MKNQSKNEVNMGRPPGLHFLWIFRDLGTQLKDKLGGKSEPRQEKTGQDRYERVLKKDAKKGLVFTWSWGGVDQIRVGSL